MGLHRCRRLPPGHRPGARAGARAALHGLGHRSCGHQPFVGSPTPRRMCSPTLTGPLAPPPFHLHERSGRPPPGTEVPGFVLTKRTLAPTLSRPLPVSLSAVLRDPGAIQGHLVPSSWSCSTSTACSASALRACCIPLPVLGFTTFHRPRPTPRSVCGPFEVSPADSRSRSPHFVEPKLPVSAFTRASASLAFSHLPETARRPTPRSLPCRPPNRSAVVHSSCAGTQW